MVVWEAHLQAVLADTIAVLQALAIMGATEEPAVINRVAVSQVMVVEEELHMPAAYPTALPVVVEAVEAVEAVASEVVEAAVQAPPLAMVGATDPTVRPPAPIRRG